MSETRTTSIRCTSKASVKIKDSYYTLEYSEERCIGEDADVSEEREKLWAIVNGEVDNQIDDIISALKR